MRNRHVLPEQTDCLFIFATHFDDWSDNKKNEIMSNASSQPIAMIEIHFKKQIENWQIDSILAKCLTKYLFFVTGYYGLGREWSGCFIYLWSWGCREISSQTWFRPNLPCTSSSWRRYVIFIIMILKNIKCKNLILIIKRFNSFI